MCLPFSWAVAAQGLTCVSIPVLSAESRCFRKSRSRALAAERRQLSSVFAVVVTATSLCSQGADWGALGTRGGGVAGGWGHGTGTPGLPGGPLPLFQFYILKVSVIQGHTDGSLLGWAAEDRPPPGWLVTDPRVTVVCLHGGHSPSGLFPFAAKQSAYTW